MSIIKGGLLTKTEVPSGTIDGVNDTFTTSRPYVPGTLVVSRNGLVLTPGASNDFVEIDTTTFQFNSERVPSSEGSYTDQLLVSYQIY